MPVKTMACTGPGAMASLGFVAVGIISVVRPLIAGSNRR